jgi:hypothetical protein
MVDATQVEPLQALIQRAGLAVVMAMAFAESAPVALPGRIPRWCTAAVFALCLGGFVGDVLALPALMLAVPALCLVVRAYLHHPGCGYVTPGEDGRMQRQVYHHLHLVGLCALGALVAEATAAIIDGGSPRLRDRLFTQVEWVCIGGHYATSAASKLLRRGGSWPDRRLFPFYLALCAAFHLGDSGTAMRRGGMAGLACRPAMGVLMLWGALVVEAAGIVYPFGPWPRALVGSALIGMHLLCLRLFRIDFRENLLLLAIFSFDHVALLSGEHQAMPSAPLDITVMVAGLVALIALSLAIDERCYPFSSLGMFTSPYRRQPVVLLGDESGGNFLAVRRHGVTTSGLSSTYVSHLADGSGVEGFRAWLVTAVPEAAGRWVWVREIEVDGQGRVEVRQRRLEGVIPPAVADRSAAQR